MELAVYGNEAEEQILAVASLDNLGKGASGAAVQCINLKTGVDETTGLDGRGLATRPASPRRAVGYNRRRTETTQGFFPLREETRRGGC